jgi:cyclopropane fatty-acyl-phospholipid synthase-like methyltransferase
MRAIDKALPDQGTILDVGCGHGTIAKYLARRPARNVIALDVDRERIQRGRAGNRLPNLAFEAGDAESMPSELAGVVLSDVMHHLGDEKSLRVIAAARSNLQDHGVLLIKEVDAGERVRAALSKLWDRILYPGDEVFYFRSGELVARLESAGFDVQMSRHSRLFPGSTTLYVCRPIE